MRILQLIDHLGAGGAQEIVIEILRSLGASDDYHFEVAQLFLGDACAERIQALNIKIHNLETGLPYRPWSAPDPRVTWRLARVLRAGNFDAVHVHLYAAPLHLHAACLLSKCRPRIYNTLHAQRAHLPWYVFPTLRFIRSRTDFFVAEATASIGDLLEAGIPAHRLAYVPIGIRPIAPANPSEVANWCALHHIPPDAQILISIARLHPQRQIDRIIGGFALHVSAEPKSRAMLVIVGDGEQRGELESLTRALNVEQRVRFTGHCDSLPALLGAASIYAGIEIQGDLSIAPLQALSVGVPCVALDFEARRRVTEEELSDINLCLVEPTEVGFAAALGRVFGSSRLVRHLVDHGKDVISRRRTVRSMIDGYEQLYKGGHPGLSIIGDTSTVSR